MPCRRGSSASVEHERFPIIKCNNEIVGRVGKFNPWWQRIGGKCYTALPVRVGVRIQSVGVEGSALVRLMLTSISKVNPKTRSTSFEKWEVIGVEKVNC